MLQDTDNLPVNSVFQTIAKFCFKTTVGQIKARQDTTV